MRTLLIAGTAMASLLGAQAATAGQRVVQRGPGVTHMGARPGAMHVAPRAGQFQVVQHRAPRWGSKVGGRWWGGVNAPGGWRAYRRPVRGWALPVYWNTPRFYISDWSVYGLQQPQYGYNWVRYYDDAVLVDSRGSVYDSVSDVDWDRQDGYSDDGRDDRAYADDDGYEPPIAPDYSDDRRYERRDNGVGGALAGAAVGGVAGALIGGRGDRLGGALIGAGVGGLAGYAIDKAEDRGGRAPPPPLRGAYGADHTQPGYAPHHMPPPPRRYPPAPIAGGGHWVSPDGGTTVVTSGGGYGGSYTTVTVQTAPVVTTTTTEIYEDHVTYTRPMAKKKIWRAKRKLVCRCR
jgi:Ni/Co efflux regulator RcnB